MFDGILKDIYKIFNFFDMLDFDFRKRMYKTEFFKVEEVYKKEDDFVLLIKKIKNFKLVKKVK